MKNRYIMKLSGESFIGNGNLDFDKALEVARQIVQIQNENNGIAVVCGAGNIVRGRSYSDKIHSDYMGMMATNINITLLYSALITLTPKVKTFSLIKNEFIDNYDIDLCLKYYNNGYIVLIGGGNGLVGFTTDYAVVRRAIELNCNKILFGKAVDGVYDKNPEESDAKKYDYITPMELLNDRINQKFYKNGVIDDVALTDLIKTNIEIYVYLSKDYSAIQKILNNQNPGTIISNNKPNL